MCLNRVLSSIKGKFILSYNNCELVQDLYKDYSIIEVSRLNALSGKVEKRGEFKELIIKNIEGEVWGAARIAMTENIRIKKRTENGKIDMTYFVVFLRNTNYYNNSRYNNCRGVVMIRIHLSRLLG